MDTKTFDKLRHLVYAHSGIALGPTKEALVSARVGKRLRVLGMESPREYLAFLGRAGNDEEFVHFIDAISTNVTSFFRESTHFDFMTETFAHWVRQGQDSFTVWSAAASTGEEPYTIAMTALEALQGHRARVRILATDISTEVLEKCRAAVYEAEKVESVPAPLRVRYFEKMNGGAYQANAKLRNMISFHRLNLSVTPFPMKGPMDLIFIRNVMIYFEQEVRRRLLSEAHRLLRPDGFLIVGHSEGLTGLVSNFTLVKSSIYKKLSE